MGVGFEEVEARRLAETGRWTIAPDGDRWRRVVASPDPVAIVESSAIQAQANPPPVRRSVDGHLSGVEAVIDKDLATALIARDFLADVMLILTDVPGIFCDYGTPEQRVIRLATAKELRAMTFSAGSMGPKVEAACRFVEATGQRAVIGMLDDAQGLLAGTSGTTVVLDAQARP